MGTKPIPIEDAVERDFADIRVAASTSFTEPEVLALLELFAALRRGGDARMLMRSAPLANVQRKVSAMTKTIARQHERRAAKAAR